jgi:hypothetical protein
VCYRLASLSIIAFLLELLQRFASASAREAQATRNQFAKTGAKAIHGHIKARGQRQQARRDSR